MNEGMEGVGPNNLTEVLAAFTELIRRQESTGLSEEDSQKMFDLRGQLDSEFERIHEIPPADRSLNDLRLYDEMMKLAYFQDKQNRLNQGKNSAADTRGREAEEIERLRASGE